MTNVQKVGHGLGATGLSMLVTTVLGLPTVCAPAIAIAVAASTHVLTAVVRTKMGNWTRRQDAITANWVRRQDAITDNWIRRLDDVAAVERTAVRNAALVDHGLTVEDLPALPAPPPDP